MHDKRSVQSVDPRTRFSNMADRRPSAGNGKLSSAFASAIPAVVPEPQDTVRFSADGLAKVPGDLEARVIAAMWKLGRPSSARTVHELVARDHTSCC